MIPVEHEQRYHQVLQLTTVNNGRRVAGIFSDHFELVGVMPIHTGSVPGKDQELRYRYVGNYDSY